MGKHLLFCWMAALSAAAGAGAGATEGALCPADLRCEYGVNPLGVDVQAPRLSWVLESSVPAARQTAWHVLAATDPHFRDDTVLWDSGKVTSARQNQVAYAGQALPAHGWVYWKVRAWDGEDRPGPWSAVAHWSMGPLSEAGWGARWISSSVEAPSPGAVLPLFRRTFTAEKPLRRAVLHACGLGLHEWRVNGLRVTENLFEPGWTDYTDRCLYSSHDVTDLLRQGENVIGAMLGNGFYNVEPGRYTKYVGSFGPLKLIAHLRLEYADGSSASIVSDGAWRTSPGPVVFSSIYGGEDHDARLERPGWDAPGHDDSGWAEVACVDGPGGRLAWSGAPPIRVRETMPVQSVTEPRPGVYVYDFGQNASGVPEVCLRGPAGATVRLTPGELLDGEGMVTQRSSGGPMWFSYVLRGQGEETWRPRFSYYGFRYVQVEGAAPEGEAEQAELLSVRHAFTHALPPSGGGTFRCGDPLLNDIHQLILAAMRSNFQSVLTDCPHREKLGWLEVSHLLGDALSCNFDTAAFYTKVSLDMSDSQVDSGLVPDIAPEYTVFQGGFRDSPEWGSACILNPWHVYCQYGDTRILEENYGVMARYVDYLASKADGHIVSHGLGDWYDIGPNPPGVSQLTSLGVTATGVYYQDLSVVAKVAALLGREDDARAYEARAAAVRAAFNEAFYRSDAQGYDRNSQTANAMALTLGLVEDGNREAVLNTLVTSIREGGYRVTAGDVGFAYLVRVLTESGHGETLLRMVRQTDGPGYARQLAEGATSLTEAWDANPNSSHNHCMLGHAEAWLFRGLAGIQCDPENPGFRHFFLRPEVYPELGFVEASYASIAGDIRSAWRVTDGRMKLEVTIPPNTAATVRVPRRDGATPGGMDPLLHAVLEETPDHVTVRLPGGDYTFVSEGW